MKPDNFHHQEYSGYCLHFHCYTLNVSADISFGLLQVFRVEFRTAEDTRHNEYKNLVEKWL